MPRKQIVGIIGARLAGKKTAVEVIKGVIPIAVETQLDAKLHTICAQVFNIPVEHFTHPVLATQEMDVLVYLNRLNILAVVSEFDSGIMPAREFIQPHVGQVLITPKQVAGYVGREILRVINADIHCESVLNNIKEGEELILISDLKFPAELNFFKSLKDYDFISVFIQNTAAEHIAGNSGDISEKYIKTIGAAAQFTIHNNGSLEYFKDLCRNFARGLRHG